MIRWRNSCIFMILLVGMPILAADVLDRIIAKVDHWVITQSDLDEVAMVSIAEIRQNFPKDEWDAKITELKNQIVMRMIDEYVCAAAAREFGITVSEDEVEAHIRKLLENTGITSDEEFRNELAREGMTLEEFKESIRRQSMVRKILQREVYSKVDVKPSEIEQYYRENIQLYSRAARIRVALLLLEVTSKDEAAWKQTGERAREIHREIAGGADFAEMVKTHSDGPAADQSGDIGFIEKGKGLPEFETAAFALDIGEISEPFRTDHGWNLVKVLDKEIERVKSLDEVRSEIDGFLSVLKSRELESEWMEKQRNRIHIERFSF
ncbi:peptidylprolyl isomerase [bacterium]|nr:peptidylprolyl isomerase [candidate division CSSED10-310 bacterium]